ncbi:MAG: acetate kinase [Candidatus Cloacimonadota bacterium]|nr:MAG: acetate kinase [Candidatus Cloacimonadota bacterium]
MSEVRTGKILVINCGSSSLKYEIFEMPAKKSLGKGLVERIGSDNGHLIQKFEDKKVDLTEPIQDHKYALKLVMRSIADKENGLIGDLNEITGVGHRVVHGGEKYASSVEITDDVIKAIEENINLAPLHNPPNLTGINAAKDVLPDLRQVAVFDTAFHQTMPPSAYLYGIPRELYDKYKIRRYGFHGTSHRYVASRSISLMKRFPENTNVISCHLGNGASITAIENGKSVDTSMGFTPLEGVVMGTRSGDIDPSIIFYLLEQGYTKDELNTMLNKKSGLLGLSGISNDLRDVEKAAAEGNKKAIETLDLYAYRIRKYIGAYVANMVKVDLLVFTGGIGENAFVMRERICHRLENLGIYMDYEKNAANGSKEGVISHNYSPTTIMVVPTNEELQIAVDTYQIISGEYSIAPEKTEVNI